MTTDPTQPSKLSGIPRRMKIALKRTKSVGKFEKTERNQYRPTKEDIEEFDSPTAMFPHIKPSRSHESLMLGPHTSLDVIDLAGNDLVVRPLHSSILGQDHCFQIKTSLGSKYYSCRSASERDKWIESILSAHYPDKDERRRTDSSLNVWVVEAKNIPQKKKYFCEICLDDSLYARTTPKHRSDMVFWGEQFNFKRLPAVEAINVHVYKEIEKKKRRDKNYLGLVSIPVNMVNSKTTVESWYPLSSPINFRGETPSLRIKARYQNISILPISQYSELAQYLKENSVTLCHRLEQDIGVRTKEEVATSLMKVLHCLGTAKEFLTEMVMTETEGIKDESLVFRANTMATKSMEAYMKLIGGKYLQDTLGDFIQYLYMNNEDCEVDPSKMVAGSLQQHQASLMVMCEMACCKILNSSASFPSDLRSVFFMLRERFSERINGDEVCSKLISGCIFLRFLCPAIMSPSLFDLIQEYPNEKTSRCLTLIAKTVQALANFTKFGAKEGYMVFMNEFLEREWGNMKVFLQEISSGTDKSHAVKFSGYIDLGRELALTHSLLVEAMESFDKPTKEKLGPLPAIVTNITEQINQPGKFITYQSGNVSISNTVTSATSTTSSSSSSVSQAKKNLSKIFEDAEPSNAGDVEMLPPYDVAMDKTITKSSTINSLVDFIQHDADSTTSSTAKLDSRAMNAKNVDIVVEPNLTKVEMNERVITQSEIEVNVRPLDSNLDSSQQGLLRVVEEERDQNANGRTIKMRVDPRSEVKEKSSHVYTVSIEKVCHNSTVSTTLSTSNTNKPKMTDSVANGQNHAQSARTLPLSFSNPAFQLSSRALRQRDAGTDSMSSVNSSPSNGADSDMSNLDGDVSHSSSSSGASPPHLRRDKFLKVQSLDDDASRRKGASTVYTSSAAHTLPKASSRLHAEMIGDIFQKPDSHLTESQSSSSIHSKLTLPISSTYTSTATLENADSTVSSPTEAVKALNNAHRQAFFSSLMSPLQESSSSPAISTSNQATQMSEATLQIGDESKPQLPAFSLIMPNPKTALLPNSGVSSSFSLPTRSSGQNVVRNSKQAHSEMVLTTIAEHQSQNNSKMAHITITPTHPARVSPSKERMSVPSSHSTPVMGLSVLETTITANKNRTANNSTGSQSSPPMGQLPRRNIVTQFSSKPKQASETSPRFEAPVTESVSLQIETRPSRVQSGQVVHRIHPSGAVQSPIWMKRGQDSPVIDRQIQTDTRPQSQYEEEINTLKEELDKMASQLAETRQKLEEEEEEAEAALAELRLKVEKTEVELKVQQEEKDQQIRDVINRLMCVEEELRNEQEEMRTVIRSKQQVIDAQENRIQSLDMANQRLLRALQHLKQRCLTNHQPGYQH